jgi:cyclic-di-GMP-binding biofilm dispersal mediator protein
MEKNVLVVGASGVFGSLFCKELQDKGYQVLSAARKTKKIPAGVKLALKVDLEDEASIDLLTNYLIQENMPLHGIVIASGAVGFGRIEETSAEHSKQLMQINHLGPARLISNLLPLIQEEGFVVGINGVVSEKVFPGMAAYTASKQANAAFLSTLTMELRRKKVHVLDAKPGHTETGLASRALFGTAPNFPTGMTPEHVVGTIMTAITEGKPALTSEDF